VKGLAFSANFRPDTLFVPDLRAEVAGQPLAARLLVWNFAAPMLDGALRGNLDLAAIAPLVAPAGTKLGGRAVVNMSARGAAADPGAMSVGGSAQLQNVSVESAGLPSKIENVNGRVDFLPERATIQRLSARAGKSSLQIDANVSRPLALMAAPGKVAPADVEFSFRSSYLDLAELLPTTPGAPFLPNASGGGHVSIDRLKQGKLDVTNVLADVVLEPAQLSSPRFSLQGYGGTVTGNAKFDLRDTRKPVYAIHSQVDRVKADAILGAWTPVKDLLVGTLSTNLDFSGAGQTPDDIKHTLTLVGLAALTYGRLGPGPALETVAQFVKIPKFKQLDFAKLELPLRIERGRLISDPVVLNGPSGEWRLAGAIGFDGALDYAVSVTLPPDVVTAVGAKSALAAGALTDAQGRMLLDLHVTGSAKSPRVSWDTNAMRLRLAGKASEALAEQRAKLEADAKEAARQAVLQRFGAQRDSASKLLPKLSPASASSARDSVKSAASGLLKNFFGKKPAPAPLVPATPPAAAPTAPSTAAPDTTQH
ncbi:MAG: AsmA-like C-terminal region-containing protein, partial [Candidatus Eisenbacteria bacterium]